MREYLSEAINPIFFYVLAGWLVLVGIRTLVWRWRPMSTCDLCGHVGRPKNTPRGSWRTELILFFILVPIGVFAHVLMGVFLTYSITRWFVIRRCETCGSERLLYP